MTTITPDELRGYLDREEYYEEMSGIGLLFQNGDRGTIARAYKENKQFGFSVKLESSKFPKNYRFFPDDTQIIFDQERMDHLRILEDARMRREKENAKKAEQARHDERICIEEKERKLEKEMLRIIAVKENAQREKVFQDKQELI
jgi:hypothetical protein